MQMLVVSRKFAHQSETPQISSSPSVVDLRDLVRTFRGEPSSVEEIVQNIHVVIFVEMRLSWLEYDQKNVVWVSSLIEASWE